MKAVAVLAQIRQSNTSLHSGWRDDPPQVFSTPQHNLVRCSVLLPHLSPLSRWPPVFFQGPKMLLCSSQSPPSAQRRLFHNLGSAISIFTTLYMFQVFFGRGLTLPLALHPFLLFLVGLLSKLLCFQSPQERNTHIPCMYWSFPSILHSVPRRAFSSMTAYHCHFVKGAPPFATNFLL